MLTERNSTDHLRVVSKEVYHASDYLDNILSVLGDFCCDCNYSHKSFSENPCADCKRGKKVKSNFMKHELDEDSYKKVKTVYFIGKKDYYDSRHERALDRLYFEGKED